MFRRMCHCHMNPHLLLPIERTYHVPQCIQLQLELEGPQLEATGGEKAVEGTVERNRDQAFLPMQGEGRQGQEEEVGEDVEDQGD